MSQEPLARDQNEPTAEPPMASGSDMATAPVDVASLSRLLDEIRADRRWREEIAALRRRESAAGAPAAEGAGAAEATPMPTLVALPADAGLAAAIETIANAIQAADAVVPIERGRPVIGEAWAALRRQIHADIRLYQDRQTAANLELVAALRRIQALLDPLATDSPAAALWAAIGQLEARVARLEQRLDAVEEMLDRQMDGPEGVHGRLSSLEEAVEALAVEIEPLGQVRARLDAMANDGSPSA